MKILVCSDSHESYGTLEAVISSNDDIHDVIFLGDGDESFDTMDIIYPNHHYYVCRGNCDFHSDNPSEQVVELGGHRLFCTHGDDYRVKTGNMSCLLDKAKSLNCDIVLYGHTHEARIEYIDGIYCCNPGSLSHPYNGGLSWMELNLDGKNIVPIIVPFP